MKTFKNISVGDYVLTGFDTVGVIVDIHIYPGDWALLHINTNTDLYWCDYEDCIKLTDEKKLELL